jgi:hypothetical protein
MTKIKLLTAVSAASLLLAGYAHAQTPQGAPPAMQKNDAAPAAKAPMPGQTAPTGAAERATEKAPVDKGASNMDKNAPARVGADQKAAPDSKMSTDTKSDTKSGANTKTTTETKSGTDTKAGATTGAAPASGNLTVEQKTKIRQTVLTSSAPRVNNVNFNITVGTVVPTSVRVVEVPPTLIEIHPEWRAYRYFVVRDEIVIVEPGTMKIIAVLAI